MSQVAVIAKLTAAAGKRAELVEVLKGTVTAVESEPGTLIYALHTAADDDVTVWFYERYTDGDVFTAHAGGTALAEMGPKLKGLLAGRPEIIRLDAVAAKGL